MRRFRVMRTELDYDPLLDRVGLRDRLKVVAANPMYVMAGTVVALLVLVPVIVFLGLLAADKAWDDGGALALLAMLVVGGLWGMASLLHEAGKGGALERFARINDLALVRASGVKDYAGSLFADGSHIVARSVRTREPAFVEVGDRFPLQAPKARYNVRAGIVQADGANQRELFLRGRLAGHVRHPDSVRAEGELHDRLVRFAGEYTIERSRNELTVFGSRQLDPDEPGRVQEAFALLDDLVAQNDATLPAEAVSAAAEQPAYEPAPAAAKPRSTRKALRMVGVTLGLLIVLPLGLAFVMSIVDDVTSSRVVAVIAVLAFVSVVGKAIESVLRRATSGERDEGKKRARWPWVVGAVAFVALGVTAVTLDQDSSDVEDDDKQSAAECYDDDAYCQWDVSARVWGEEHGLTRSGEFSWGSCHAISPGRSECPIRVECAKGHADLVAVYDGKPYEVVGVRPPVDKPLAPPQPLRTGDAEIEQLVAQECGRA